MARRLLIIVLLIALGVLVVVRLTGGPHRATAWVKTSQHQTELSIVFHPDSSGRHTQRFLLRCNPAGGTLPAPAHVCRLLAAAHPFRPLPSGTVCSMIYGGPQTAFVHGFYEGRVVRATLTRVNGCQLARFAWLSELVSAHAAAGDPPAPPPTSGG